MNNIEDLLYEDAVGVIAYYQQARCSLLQKHLNIGYARAARLMDMLEDNGIVGPSIANEPREVLVAKSAKKPETNKPNWLLNNQTEVRRLELRIERLVDQMNEMREEHGEPATDLEDFEAGQRIRDEGRAFIYGLNSENILSLSALMAEFGWSEDRALEMLYYLVEKGIAQFEEVKREIIFSRVPLFSRSNDEWKKEEQRLRDYLKGKNEVDIADIMNNLDIDVRSADQLLSNLCSEGWIMKTTRYTLVREDNVDE